MFVQPSDHPSSHPPLTTLDRLAALAARLLAVPLALVCLGDEEAQARSESVCAVAALSDETYAVISSIGDRRLLADPAVAREYFTYHAGVAVRDAAGRTLGSVYVMDSQPRASSERDAAMLQDVAALAAEQLQ
ncbi:MAG TPA: GAF domain-containing protein, partial [Gemmatimonadales bacterium]|nr:GAF domain-containing protein [Gemmatimonadales bacterium]